MFTAILGMDKRIKAENGSVVRVRVRISGPTLEIVAEDASDVSIVGDWETMDALNPYAGTSLAAARIEAALESSAVSVFYGKLSCFSVSGDLLGE